MEGTVKVYFGNVCFGEWETEELTSATIFGNAIYACVEQLVFQYDNFELQQKILIDNESSSAYISRLLINGEVVYEIEGKNTIGDMISYFLNEFSVGKENISGKKWRLEFNQK